MNVKFGGGGVMVWGCITAFGVGFLHKVDGRLNGSAYIDLLGNNLIPTVHQYSMTDWIFQQDNATCHVAQQVKNWFEGEQIQVMKWPAQSPDLNPIENLWDSIAKDVDAENPTSLSSLWASVNKVWDTIPLERIKVLYESFPKRCEAVIKARGGPTKY